MLPGLQSVCLKYLENKRFKMPTTKRSLTVVLTGGKRTGTPHRTAGLEQPGHGTGLLRGGQ